LPNGVVIKNRVVLPPMTEQMSFEDGTVTLEGNYMQQREWRWVIYYTCGYINKEGKGFEGQLGADDDSKSRTSETCTCD
jgi:2,4-dienoyl-CoA reductase-like NADH-dependent reductase (Old Yellow Enzyme family)